MSNLLFNGSFERGPNPQGLITYSAGATAISGWVVSRGDIDYIDETWDAANGSRSLDLNGFIPGGIAQNFATVPGQRYRVSFDLAGNPDGGSPIKTLRVQAGGRSANFSFNTTGQSLSNMGWQRKSWIFTANRNVTTLEFVSLSTQSINRAWGPALDNVSVVSISAPPPPPTVPSIRINNVSVFEEDRGTKQASFTVTLSNTYTERVRVIYATANGSAVSSSDYIGQSGILTFNPGQRRKTIDITIKGDTRVERNEQFFVRLSNPINARIADGQGVGTIINDDDFAFRGETLTNEEMLFPTQLTQKDFPTIDMKEYLSSGSSYALQPRGDSFMTDMAVGVDNFL